MGNKTQLENFSFWGGIYTGGLERIKVLSFLNKSLYIDDHAACIMI